MQNRKNDVLVLELTDQRNSGYVREGSENTPFPQYLTAPSLRRIKNTSVERREDGSNRDIRYIAGCDTIYVDEQEKMGKKPNPSADNIFFENGALTVVNEGRTIGLFKFLKACEWNESNTNRPATAEVIFRELDNEAKAEKKLDTDNLKMKAFEIAQELSQRTENGYIYDEPRIDFLCALFNVAGYEKHEYAQKTSAIVTIAMNHPERFVNTIASKLNSIRSKVIMAEEHKVINLGKYASFTDGGLNITELKARDKAGKIDELCIFLVKPENEKYMTQMTIATDAALAKMVMAQ